MPLILIAGLPYAHAADKQGGAIQAEAKVGRDAAMATALAKVKQGVVRSAELERERGRLVWSFDISQPSKSGVTEVQVDAISGKIVSLEHESAAHEAQEKRSDAATTRKQASRSAPLPK